eukprot:gene25431-31058_t
MGKETMDDIDEEDDDAGSQEDLATTETLELAQAIVESDLQGVYNSIEKCADVNFVFGTRYGCTDGFTPLMSACYRGNADAVKALLRAGADPNYVNEADELTLFWAIDGGADILRLLCDYGADVDEISNKGWTPLSYAAACGTYPRLYSPGDSPESILKNYGATVYGAGPPSMTEFITRVKILEQKEEAEGEADEKFEDAVILPDASSAQVEWKARAAKELIVKSEQEEAEDMTEILNDMNRNPFIQRKGNETSQ